MFNNTCRLAALKLLIMQNFTNSRLNGNEIKKRKQE